VKGPARPSQPSDRGLRGAAAVEQALVQFQERLGALEREGQIFRTFSGWTDEDHLARSRRLLRELHTLERVLRADKSLRQQLALQQRNLLLRYQAFKRIYRQFWEQLTG
jgi:hypothetical protein